MGTSCWATVPATIGTAGGGVLAAALGAAGRSNGNLCVTARPPPIARTVISKAEEMTILRRICVQPCV
jgi:hypothetical protein